MRKSQNSYIKEMADVKGGLYKDRELNFTHFAVNKDTNLIVNGWDYSDYDSEDLRGNKYQFFGCDLEDNDFNPSDYKILSFNTCMRRGIDPNDDSNWSNDGITPLTESRKNKVRFTESQLHRVIKESVNRVINEISEVNPKVQQKVKELMAQIDDSNTMYEILETTPADGLTIWEAMEVFNALEHMWYDTKQYNNIGGQDYNDVTPYQYD